jgi:hypothetical protein
VSSSAGTFKRAELNIVFDETGPFSDACLKHIEDVGRAKIIQRGSIWTVIIDKPRGTREWAGSFSGLSGMELITFITTHTMSAVDQIDISYAFSAGNILPGTFSWQGFEDSEKVDAIELSYWDKDHTFKKRSVLQKASWYESLQKEPNIAQIEIRGCNSRQQAIREAIFRMQKTEFITRHGSLQTTIAAMAIERGDVVAIVHPTNRYGFGGRLATDHTNATIIYLDQWITLPSADYLNSGVIFIVNPEGVMFEFLIEGPLDIPTNYITIPGGGKYWDSSISDWVDVESYTGLKFDTFSIGRPNRERLYYQIMNKRFIPATENNQASIELEFVEYVPDIFYHLNYGINPI